MPTPEISGGEGKDCLTDTDNVSLRDIPLSGRICWNGPALSFFLERVSLEISTNDFSSERLLVESSEITEINGRKGLDGKMIDEGRRVDISGLEEGN